jgi:hypothetical protein
MAAQGQPGRLDQPSRNTIMRVFYPKLIGGYVLFTVLGLIAGAALSMLFMLATLPMVSLFPEPSAAPQVALVMSAFIGIIAALVVAALSIGAWQKRLQADYYRERAEEFYFEAPRYAEPSPRQKPRRVTPSNYYGPRYSGPDYIGPVSHSPLPKRRRIRGR